MIERRERDDALGFHQLLCASTRGVAVVRELAVVAKITFN